MSEPRDHELEEHLAGRSEVSRLYRQAGADEPPPELDSKIKAAARRALATRRPRWMLPLSAAAVVMLSVGVLLRMQQEGVTPMPAEPGVMQAPAATFPLPPEPTPAAAESAADAAMAPAPPSAEPAPEARARESEADNAQPFPAAPASSAPHQEKSRAYSADEAAGALRSEESEITPAAPPAAASQSREKTESRRSMPAAAADAERTAENWIEHIRRLRAEGRMEEASQELKAFRERYPDHPLPDDLR
jgi:hypothetical protein